MCLNGLLLTVTIGLKCQTVGRLAFPHVSLGQVRLDLAAEPRVRYMYGIRVGLGLVWLGYVGLWLDWVRLWLRLWFGLVWFCQVR